MIQHLKISLTAKIQKLDNKGLPVDGLQPIELFMENIIPSSPALFSMATTNIENSFSAFQQAVITCFNEEHGVDEFDSMGDREFVEEDDELFEDENLEEDVEDVEIDKEIPEDIEDKNG